MPIRKRKPTSPGRRFQTVSDFAEVTKDRPEKSLTKPKPRTGGRNAYGRMTSRHRGGGHKQRYRVVDFKRNKDGVPAKVAAIEYDPNRNARIALLHYLDGEKRYILAPAGVCGRRHAAERSGLRDPRRQRAAAALHPGRYRRAQRRAEAGCRRQDGPRRRCGDPAHRQGGRLRDAAPPVHRDAPRADRLPRHRRLGRQQRGRPDLDRQGRPQPLEGQAPARPWCRHEPGRPPARWRRGQELRWPSPGVAVGQARRPHPQEGQGLRQAHRPPPAYPRRRR